MSLCSRVLGRWSRTLCENVVVQQGHREWHPMYINIQNKNKFLNQYSKYCISPDSLTPRIANWTRRSKVGNFRQGGARRSQPGRNISFVTGVRIIYLSFLLAFSLALSKVRGLSSAQQLRGEGGAACCCWGWEGAGGGIGGGGIDVSQCWVGKAWWTEYNLKWETRVKSDLRYWERGHLEQGHHPRYNVSEPGRDRRRQLVLLVTQVGYGWANII